MKIKTNLKIEVVMRKFIKRFANDVSGVADLEYGLIVGGIGLAIIAGVQYVGMFLIGTFVEAGVAIPPTSASNSSAASMNVAATAILQYCAAVIGFAIAVRAAAQVLSKRRATNIDNIDLTKYKKLGPPARRRFGKRMSA